MANIIVFPTVNDIGGAGKGEILSEQYLSALISCFIKGNTATAGFVYSGFSVSYTGLFATLTGGFAVVRGRVVEVVGTTVFSVVISSTNYISLSLTLSGYNVVGVQVSCSTNATIPTNGIRLWKVVAGGSAITSAVDYRPILLANVNAPTW